MCIQKFDLYKAFLAAHAQDKIRALDAVLVLCVTFSRVYENGRSGDSSSTTNPW